MCPSTVTLFCSLSLTLIFGNLLSYFISMKLFWRMILIWNNLLPIKIYSLDSVFSSLLFLGWGLELDRFPTSLCQWSNQVSKSNGLAEGVGHLVPFISISSNLCPWFSNRLLLSQQSSVYGCVFNKNLGMYAYAFYQMSQAHWIFWILFNNIMQMFSRGGRPYRYPAGRNVPDVSGIAGGMFPYDMGSMSVRDAGILHPIPIGELTTALANATPEQQRTVWHSTLKQNCLFD